MNIRVVTVAGTFERTPQGVVFVRGFCPTGQGGGIDNSCGKGGSGGGSAAAIESTLSAARRQADYLLLRVDANRAEREASETTDDVEPVTDENGDPVPTIDRGDYLHELEKFQDTFDPAFKEIAKENNLNVRREGRIGSEYWRFLTQEDEDGDVADDFQVRVSDHPQKYAATWSFELEHSDALWKSGFDTVVRRAAKAAKHNPEPGIAE